LVHRYSRWAGGELYPLNRWENHRPAADLQKTIMNQVGEFCGGRSEDDAAPVVVEVK
jgi:hypothetical protein